jgi:hypothetical protein
MSIYHPRKGMTTSMWPHTTFIDHIPENAVSLKLHVKSSKQATVLKNAFEAVCNVMQAGKVYGAYCTPFFSASLDMDGEAGNYILTIKWVPRKGITQDINENIDQD